MLRGTASSGKVRQSGRLPQAQATAGRMHLGDSADRGGLIGPTQRSEQPDRSGIEPRVAESNVLRTERRHCAARMGEPDRHLLDPPAEFACLGARYRRTTRRDDTGRRDQRQADQGTSRRIPHTHTVIVPSMGAGRGTPVFERCRGPCQAGTGCLPDPGPHPAVCCNLVRDPLVCEGARSDPPGLDEARAVAVGLSGQQPSATRSRVMAQRQTRAGESPSPHGLPGAGLRSGIPS